MTESASEHTLSLGGYEVIVSTALDDTIHITCPDLP